jgi:hypothetical protein
MLRFWEKFGKRNRGNFGEVRWWPPVVLMCGDTHSGGVVGHIHLRLNNSDFALFAYDNRLSQRFFALN